MSLQRRSSGSREELAIASSPLSPVDGFTKSQIQAHVIALRSEAFIRRWVPPCVRRPCMAWRGCVDDVLRAFLTLRFVPCGVRGWAPRYRPVIMRLMEHPMNGGVFNEPVDPVALDIPDYFDIVRGCGGVLLCGSRLCSCLRLAYGSRTPPSPSSAARAGFDAYSCPHVR